MKKYFRIERITEDEFITATGFDVGDYGQTTVISDGIIYTAVESDVKDKRQFAEVEHGTWTIAKYDTHWCCYCSNCKQRTDVDRNTPMDEEYPHCPKCGAIMDKKEDD